MGWSEGYSHFHNDCLFFRLKKKLIVWSRVLNALVRCFSTALGTNMFSFVAYIHTYTYTYTRTHACMHTYIHTYVCRWALSAISCLLITKEKIADTCIDMYTHAYTYIHTCTYIHAYIHTYAGEHSRQSVVFWSQGKNRRHCGPAQQAAWRGGIPHMYVLTLC